VKKTSEKVERRKLQRGSSEEVFRKGQVKKTSERVK
jgi:hypothetical protein